MKKSTQRVDANCRQFDGNNTISSTTRQNVSSIVGRKTKNDHRKYDDLQNTCSPIV